MADKNIRKNNNTENGSKMFTLFNVDHTSVARVKVQTCTNPNTVQCSYTKYNMLKINSSLDHIYNNFIFTNEQRKCK